MEYPYFFLYRLPLSTFFPSVTAHITLYPAATARAGGFGVLLHAQRTTDTCVWVWTDAPSFQSLGSTAYAEPRRAKACTRHWSHRRRTRPLSMKESDTGLAGTAGGEPACGRVHQTQSSSENQNRGVGSYVLVSCSLPFN